jgi:hypothetical protein
MTLLADAPIGGSQGFMELVMTVVIEVDLGLAQHPPDPGKCPAGLLCEHGVSGNCTGRAGCVWAP